MVVYLSLLIPFIVTGIFYLKFRSEFVWWEFFIPIGSVLVAIVISKAIIDHSAVSFTEYWGSTVTSVYEEEPYNYWKHETCSYPCGKDSKGNTIYCTRDCSHQEDVGPKWWAKTNIGESFSISEKTHDRLAARFKTSKRVVDSHHNYDSDDYCTGSSGTKFQGKRVGETSYVYETNWSGTEDTRKSYVSEHTYENRIKASDLTIFNIKLVNDSLADSLKLFKYPEYNDGGFFSYGRGLDYPTILGGNVSNVTQEKFRNLNGKYGPSNQLRLWILVFENKPLSIALQQENYWVRGNKNELIVCIGKKGTEIQWSYAFSWSLSQEVVAAAKDEVMGLYTYKDSVIKKSVPPVLPVGKDLQKKILGKVGEKLPQNIMPLPNTGTSNDSIIKIKSSTPQLTEKTWDDYYKFLDKNLDRFKRRSFEEFSYLTVEPSTGAIIFIYIFALIVSIGMNIWVIKNDIYE